MVASQMRKGPIRLVKAAAKSPGAPPISSGKFIPGPHQQRLETYQRRRDGWPADAREPWQTKDIDKLPKENTQQRQYRRPGLLINETRRIPTVWFNPLYYGTTEQVWAGLAHAMLQQLSSQIEDPIEREEFWFRLQLRRINVDAVMHDLRKAVWLRFVPWIVGYVVAGMAVLVASVLEPVWSLFGVLGAVVACVHGRKFKKKADKTWSLEKQFETYVMLRDDQ